MPARPPAQAAARLDRRAAPRRHLPVDHPGRAQLRHRTHQVPHLASLSPGWSPGWRIRGRRGVPGHDPLVALGLAVVAWRAGLGLLLAGALADDAGEVVGAVAGAVVGDDAVDVGDAVGGEPDLGSGEECGCGRPLLV